MKKILLLKGLPASGKTTWAMKMLAGCPGGFKRVNKDDIRAMIDGSHWTKNNEKFVVKVRDQIVIASLKDGKNVIVDDTNLHPKHEEAMMAIAKENDAIVEVVPFDVTVQECIERDSKRQKPVGEKIIRNMYDQFLKPQRPTQVIDPELPWAVIVDMDGTLAKMKDRGPFDWSKVGQDDANEPVRQLVLGLPVRIRIIVLSGRDSVCRKETEAWLADKIGNTHEMLLMRTEGDMRKDSIVKRELYDQHIKGKYNVSFVIDDRDNVVRMWREELGLTCFQADYGAF